MARLAKVLTLKTWLLLLFVSILILCRTLRFVLMVFCNTCLFIECYLYEVNMTHCKNEWIFVHLNKEDVFLHSRWRLMDVIRLIMMAMNEWILSFVVVVLSIHYCILYGDDAGNTIKENSCICCPIWMCYLLSCRHADSKTLLQQYPQQYPPVLRWGAS